MKLTTPIPKVLLLAAVLLCTGMFLSPRDCCAQGGQSWWGSSSWFDWSDYRARFDLRFWLPRLTSGSLETEGRTFEFKKDLGFNDDPEPFKELRIEAYIDRLGLRLVTNESERFQGSSQGNFIIANVSPDSNTAVPLGSVPQLEFGGTRVGLDLDIIRYPTVRLGVDVDYQKDKITFRDAFRRHNGTNTVVIGEFTAQFSGRQTVTTGFHASALPGRIRDIPITIQGRVRFPVPYVSSKLLNTSCTDWEVSAGLRPAIWETSLYGLSTFSVAIELGFRSMNLEFTDKIGHPFEQGTVKASFQGGFIQLGFVY